MLHEQHETFTANWIKTAEEDLYAVDHTYKIEGTIVKDPKSKSASRTVEFTLTDNDEIRYFKGSIDNNRSKMSGHWWKDASYQGDQHRFEFILASNVPGTMTLKIADQDPIVEDIVVDFKLKEIRSPEGQEPNVDCHATEAVDTAELMFFILQSDVSYLHYKQHACI